MEKTQRIGEDMERGDETLTSTTAPMISVMTPLLARTEEEAWKDREKDFVPDRAS